MKKTEVENLVQVYRLVFYFFMPIPSTVWWKEVKKRLFRFTLKQDKAKKHLFRFALKRKRKFFGSETKRKYDLLISLRSEAKNSKRKEAKKKYLFFTWACETDLVSLWSEKIFFGNQRTLLRESITNTKTRKIFEKIRNPLYAFLTGLKEVVRVKKPRDTVPLKWHLRFYICTL
jgi:hypothetical protein